MRRKLILILLGGLAALLLLGGGAVLWAGHYMRTPEFRAEFARLLHEATGQEVTLAGELSVSVFPWLGIRADGVSLGDAPGFGPEPMLTARSLSARVRVLPLFSRRLSLDVLELGDAAVSLRINAEGVGNWESLVARIRAGEDALGAQDTRFRKVSVRGVRIKGGRAKLVDDKRGQAYEITNVTLSTGRIETGRPLAFALACDFRWERPGLDSRLDVSGTLRWDEAHGRPVFTDTRAVGEIGGDFMPAAAPRAAVSAALGLEDGDRSLRVSSLRIHVFGADVTGDLLFVDFLERFEMRGAVHVAKLVPRELVNAYFPQTIPEGHQGALASAEGPVELFANEDEMTFTTPGAKLDGAHVKGRVRLGFGDTPGLDFALVASRLDLDAYHAALNANPASSPAQAGDLPVEYLARVAGQGRISAETLKLAGVTAQGAELDWRAAGGTHRVALKPSRAEGGQFSGELSATLGGTKQAPVLGYAAGLRLEGADVRQVSWLSRPGGGLSGRVDLRLRGELPKAAIAPAAKLSAVVRRATGEASLNLAPAALEFAEAQARPGESPRRMAFSSLSAQARLTPGAAPGSDWAVQAEGSLAAVGTKPLLNLDGRFSALVRPGQKGGLALANAAVTGRLKGWFLPRRENEASFSARGSADFSAQTLALPQVTAQACGLNLAGSLAGAQILDKGWTLSGHARCLDGDPRRVLAALDVRPLKPADRRALTRITGEADLALSAKGLSLSNISAQLDDTSVRGSYAVQGFDQPKQTFSLQAGTLDLDRYRAAPEPTAKRGSRPEPRPAPEPLPVDELRDLALEGSLAFRELKLYGLTARRLKAGLLAKGGTCIVKPLAAEFYGGELTGELVAQTVQKSMQTRVSLAAKGFQSGGLMLGWAGREYVNGKADLFVDVGGTGATDTDVLRTLEGMAGFKITDGSYALSGAPSGSAEQPQRKSPPGATPQGPARRPGTPFWTAGAKVKVAGGVFQTNDFRLDGPENVVTGKGGFSLAEDTINVSLTASMPGVPDVPIRVFGRLKDPEMEVPPGLLINNALKEILGLPLKPIKFFKDLLF